MVERQREETEPNYPGRIFEDASLDYAAAMGTFVEVSTQTRLVEKAAKEQEKQTQQGEIRQLRQEEEKLRDARRKTRLKRKQEDAAWQQLRQQQRQQDAELSKRGAYFGERKVIRSQRRVLKQQRRRCLEQRQQENKVWREQRQQLRRKMEALPVVTTWIAILVVTDNCTRQCLGLPLFVAGSRVTADMVVDALRTLLPDELQFLISDRGGHFTAQVFQELACQAEFIHVLIARHRPQSNGIAERFVRTLKEWLAAHSWDDDSELAQLLTQFRACYNDRPHQGLALPGLSPNEFANRIWLM